MSAVDKNDLQEYYNRIFPVRLISQWLSYGVPSLLLNREFSFAGGSFVKRFMTFPNADALHAELIRMVPEKIDFGAIFSHPCERKGALTLTPEQRELVFDIDISDYDNVRDCCSEKTICVECWPLIASAVHALSELIRHDLGFSQLFWVYSGRRGVHAWVCDESARQLTDDERNALVGYLTVYEGGTDPFSFATNCDTELRKKGWLHPSIRLVLEKHLANSFEATYLNPSNKNCVASNEKTRQALSAYLLRVASGLKNVERVVEALDRHGLRYSDLCATAKSHNLLWAVEGLVLATTYPRLDVNVSRMRNHLLKSPLVIHPGTGRLCCPIPEHTVDTFDPTMDPPTLRTLVEATHRGDPLDLSEWFRPILEIIRQYEK